MYTTHPRSWNYNTARPPAKKWRGPTQRRLSQIREETVVERHKIPNDEVAVHSLRTWQSETAGSQEVTKTARSRKDAVHGGASRDTLGRSHSDASRRTEVTA
jgi:hypothetical protein